VTVFFYPHYLPHLFREPFTDNHRELARLLDTEAILLVLAFRGWGKSTLVTYAETLRLLVLGGMGGSARDLASRVDFAVLTSRTDAQTWPLVLQLRIEFEENARLAQDFGPFERGPVWQANRFALSDGREVMGRSLFSSTRGPRSLQNRRPQLWVLDDLQELKDGKNPERAEEILAYLKSTVLPAMHARRFRVRVIGTKMSEDCAIAKLEGDPHYPRFRLDAQRADGAPTEPERFPRAFLDEGPDSKKALMGSDAYSREYLNTALSRSGLVRRAWIRFYRAEDLRGPDGALPLVCGTFWDPALAPGGDCKAIVTLGAHLPSGRLYVLDAFVRRDASPDEQAAEFCRQWERAARRADSTCALGYEANGFQALLEYPIEAHREALGLPALPIRQVTHTQPKELRVAALAPLFERGAIFFLEDDVDQRTLADQWVFWPKGDKDGPDAMRGAWDLVQRLTAPVGPLIAARQSGAAEAMAAWR